MEGECCHNCKKYKLHGGKCLGVKSRHCVKYKQIKEDKDADN